MRTFKRDNWSNEQIIKFLDDQKIVNVDGAEHPHFEQHNSAIDDVKSFFFDFTRPVEEFGAMGYCEEEDAVYHIGGIPEDARIKVDSGENSER